VKIDVQAVEAELSRIQRELTHTEVRTSLFNLVVMSPDAERVKADEAVNYLLGKRAARVIHIVNTDAEASSLDVSARCFVDREHKGVCFQEIIITNGRDGAGGAPGSWIPLLVRDIPTYVLWLDTVGDKETLFSRVHGQADKVIVDSDHCVDLGDDPDRILALLSRVTVEEAVPVADFGWRRLRPYQRLIAGAFDGEASRWLGGIVSVHAVGLRPASGRLLGLWLAERLGWTRIGSSQFRDVRGHEIAFECTHAGPSCDVTIEIELSDRRVVEIRANRDGCAEVEYPGGADEQFVAVPSNGEILLEEVDAVYADDLYRDALAVVLTPGTKRAQGTKRA
jgi:glucose-6-phosphate dehydrogenase assembly protein OpcA